MRTLGHTLVVGLLVITACAVLTGCAERGDAPPTGSSADSSQAQIQPYSENPHYFAWGEEPIFLLGATGYHSWTPVSRPDAVDYEGQLDRLAGVIDEIESPHVRGFVRILPYDPMNHMHDGAVDRVLQPWVRLDDGRYDLERFAPAWEERLRALLDATLKRGIIVSLELWDDWSVTRGPGGQYDPGAGAGWNAHPFNPKNNVNYNQAVLPESTAVCDAPFYSTVPGRDHVQQVLRLQKRYVNRVLSVAADYPNVLINVSNESRAHRAWSRFWAEYTRERVPADMMIGEMPSVRRTSDSGQCDPGLSPAVLATDSLYDFVDVAQAVSGHSFDSFREQAVGGGRRMAVYREAMDKAQTVKPLVVSKDYARASRGGNIVLWGRFMGGAAAARFHRLGVDHTDEVIDFQHDAVHSLGRFIAEIPFWRMHPARDLVRGLPERTDANVLAERGRRVVIQLLGEGQEGKIKLDVPAGRWAVEWIDPATGRAIKEIERNVDRPPLTLSLRGDRQHRIVYITRLGCSPTPKAHEQPEGARRGVMLAPVTGEDVTYTWLHLGAPDATEKYLGADG